MPLFNRGNIIRSNLLLSSILILIISSCTTVRKYQKDKAFVYKNNIILNINGVSPDDKTIIKSRLNTQLDDSSKVRTKDVAFIFHYIDRPPAFDTIAARRSADNMQSSMVNIGFYNARTNYKFTVDSLKSKHQIRVSTDYIVDAGNRTLIDTFAYLLSKLELQQLALDTKNKSPLQKGVPITKAAVSAEENRLVDLFRNNGYYKFTTEQLRATADTSIEALTTVSSDPFEALRLLQEANLRRNKPTIKIGMQLYSEQDSSRLNKYHIGNIFILPDYVPGDNYQDSNLLTHQLKNYTIRYHKKLFLNNVLLRPMMISKGDVYKQDDYFNTLNNYYKLGVWENPSIDIVERKDSNILDVLVKLIPIKKYAVEGSIEVSYSANSNISSSISPTNSSNLLGLSGNLSLVNRNVAKQAIHMTNSIRAGVEFNTSKGSNNGSLLSSNLLSYSNNILIPKFVTPFPKLNKKKYLVNQTFVNTNISLIRRIDYFDQQIFNTAYGINLSKRQNRNWTISLNIDYRRIFNRTPRFNNTLDSLPFLRYSFNTALTSGPILRYVTTYTNPKHPLRSNIFKGNLEASGLMSGTIKKLSKNVDPGSFLSKYLKEFIKVDGEFTHTINHPKSALVYRSFIGIGIPLSKSDTTLPFFKQYFGGGPNSMRGWPVRGVGVGGQPLAPYGSTLFNDRTGDIQLEGNAEYRFTVAPLFSNAVTFKMALFADVGNIWNTKYTKTNGTEDSTQFHFKDLYKQLAVSSGVGFRFDFNYFLIRLDLGLRFKRPDIAANDGWQLPNVTFANLFGKSDENKKWRYENYNATIGIDYPF